MTRPDLTPAELAIYQQGYRDGVQTVLDYASRTATAIETTSHRKVHEGFAVAALQGLVEACVSLLTSKSERRAA